MTTSLRFDPVPATTAPSDAMLRVDDGGAPLRCCLRDSRAGEWIALLAWTPVGPSGAYRETGPVFVHAEACAGPATDGYPADWLARDQVLRAYDPDGEIAGGELVPAGRTSRPQRPGCSPTPGSRSCRPATSCTAATC